MESNRFLVRALGRLTAHTLPTRPGALAWRRQQRVDGRARTTTLTRDLGRSRQEEYRIPPSPATKRDPSVAQSMSIAATNEPADAKGLADLGAQHTQGKLAVRMA
jgi:hypothetical protein